VFDFFVANRLDVTIISHYGNEPIMERFFRRKTMAICTDGLMPGPGQKPHPRTLGAFPRALRLARELGIPLIEIVHRMTVMPSRFLRLDDPTLRPGADASLVLFDGERVRERNSYEDPAVAPEGIDWVWVHGTPVLEEGAVRVPERFEGRVLKTVGP
jgi:N-acyl-D-amino-acid deacylase